MTTWRLAAVLLVITAGLFTLGVVLERDDGHHEPVASVSGEPEAAGHDEATEAAENHEGSERSEAVESAGDRESSANETVLGLDIESPVLVAAAVVVSLGLAAALWIRQRRTIALVVAGFAVVFAVLDLAELAHQVDEHRTGLAILAAAIAIGHFTVGALTGGRSRRINL